MDDSLEMTQEETTVGCPAVGYQEVNVSVPVTIRAFGEAGNVKTECLGESVVTSGDEADSSGEPGGVCRLTISQKLRVEIPVIFGARAEVGDASVDCGCSESTSGCNACDSFPTKIF